MSSLLENSTIIGHNIPLKIVHHQDSSLTNENNYLSIIPNGIDGGTQRKSSQNMIEKRYRSSINEKINELKEIVAPSDGKVGEEAQRQRNRRRLIRVAIDITYRRAITWTEQLFFFRFVFDSLLIRCSLSSRLYPLPNED